MYLYLFLVSVRQSQQDPTQTSANTDKFEVQQLAVACHGKGGRSRTQTVATAGGGGHTFVELKHYCSIKHVWHSLSLSYLLCSQRTCLISMSLIFRISNSTRDCLPLYASDSSYRLIILFFVVFLD